MLDDGCRKAGFTPLIVAATNDIQTLVELAAEGLGVAVVTRSAAARARLTTLEIDRPRLHRRTALAWNQATTTPAGRAFLTIATRHLSAATTPEADQA